MAIYVPPPGEEFAKNIQLIIQLRQLDEDVSKNHMLKGSLFRDIGKTKEATEEYNKGLGRGAMSDLLAGTAVGNFLGIQPKLKESMFAAEPEPEKGASEEYIQNLGENISKFGKASIKQQQKEVGQSQQKWEQMFKGAKPVTPLAGEEGGEKWLTERNKMRLAGKEPTYTENIGMKGNPWLKFKEEASMKREAHKAWEDTDWNAQAQYRREFDSYAKSPKTLGDYNKMMLRFNVIDEKFGWNVAEKMKWQFPATGGGGKGDYMAVIKDAKGNIRHFMIDRSQADAYQANGFSVSPMGKDTPTSLRKLTVDQSAAADKLMKEFRGAIKGPNVFESESTIAENYSQQMKDLGYEIVKGKSGWEKNKIAGYGAIVSAVGVDPKESLNAVNAPATPEEQVAEGPSWWEELFAGKQTGTPVKKQNEKIRNLLYK